MFSRRTGWSLAPNRFTVALEEHRRQGRELLDLTASNPTEVGLTYDESTILGALSSGDALRYRPEPKGLLSARRAVERYYQECASGTRLQSASASGSPNSVALPAQPSAVDVESIVLTVSTSEAYSFVFRLLGDPDDEILVPTPSYPLFEFLAELEDIRLVPYALFYDHGWHIDLHTLERALTPRSRAVILVHPNNPTGSYVKAEEAAQVTSLCAEHEMALIVDEVFLDYALPPLGGPDAENLKTTNSGLRPQSFAFNREALTLTLSGVSKISALPQMKLAWIVTSGPEALVRGALARLEVIADTFLSQNAPLQLAAPALLGSRHSVQAQLASRILANLGELDRQLGKRSPCERLAIEGGWYAILRVPATRSDEDLAIALLREQEVLVQPGYFYDFPADGYLVLSLITPVDTFREGVSRVLSAVPGLIDPGSIRGLSFRA